MGITHATAAVGTDSGDDKISKDAWDEDHVGASFVLLASQTASSSSSLDFIDIITSTYDCYVIKLVSVAAAASGQPLKLMVSSDSGSSWSATNYVNNSLVVSSSSSVQNDNTYIAITASAGTNATSRGVAGTVEVFVLPDGKLIALTQTEYINPSPAWTMLTSGATTDTASVDSLRFVFGSGNIASGSIRVYGIAKT